jgi:hypothetical protein
MACNLLLKALLRAAGPNFILNIVSAMATAITKLNREDKQD